MRRVFLVGGLAIGSAVGLLHCGSSYTGTSDVSQGEAGTPSPTSTTPPGTPPPPPDAGATADAATGCDLTKPFGTATPIAEINGPGAEEYARLAPNGLELYFARTLMGSTAPHIMVANRASVNDTWATTTLSSELNQFKSVLARVTAPALTGDGLTMYMQLYEGDVVTTAEVYVSSRPSLASPWTAPAPVANVSHTNAADDGVWVSSSGDRIWFFTGNNPYRIVTAQKTGVTFGPSQLLFTNPPLASGDDRWPVLSDDELTLYFASYGPPPDAGAMNVYVYKSTRASKADPFGAPQIQLDLSPLGYRTIPTWLSKDGCTIYLASDRPGTQGNLDIFQAKKPL